MKTLRSTEHVRMVAELAKLIKLRLKTEKRERKIKDYLKDLLEDENNAVAGNWLVSLIHRSRTNLDREKLERLLGEQIHAYESKTNFIILDVRPR